VQPLQRRLEIVQFLLKKLEANMTPQEIKKKIDNLEKRLKQMEEFMNKKKVQQISFPLDIASKTIITNI